MRGRVLSDAFQGAGPRRTHPDPWQAPPYRILYHGRRVKLPMKRVLGAGARGPTLRAQPRTAATRAKRTVFSTAARAPCVLLLAAGLAAVSARAADSTPGASHADAYWQPRAELSAGRERRLPPWCAGAYVERAYPQPRLSEPASFPARLRADRAHYRTGDSAELIGQVVIEQGNRVLAGHRATLQEPSRRVAFPDGVTLSEPGVAMTAATADIETGGGAGRLTDVEFVLFDTELRGDAADVERTGEAWTFSGTRFTRCEPGSNTWEVAAAHLSVEDDTSFARARNAVVKVKGVPVFYVPRLRIPLSGERQSGFLFPSAGTSRDDGVRVELPYYLNLAPNYDATLTALHASERGTGLGVEARHLSRGTSTNGTGAFLPKDRRHDGQFDRDDFELQALPGPFEPADRWVAGIDHRGRFGGATTHIDAAAVSDSDYFRDMGRGLAVSSRAYLTRFAEARYASGGFSAGITGLGFQMLEQRREPYRRVPEIDLAYAGDAVGPVEWSLATIWTAFDHPNADHPGIPGGQRLHLEPRVRLPLTRPWGFLALGGGYRYTGYDLDDGPRRFDATPERGIAFGDIDAGLFFERDTRMLGTALIQTLEPRIHYLKQQYADQRHLPRFDASVPSFSVPQLFRRNRFSGLDRIGDENRLAVGLTSRLIDFDSGREYLRATVGTIAHFEDRRVTLTNALADADRHVTSPVAAELAVSAGAFSAAAGITWDPADAEEDEIGLSLQYRRDNRRILNVGHRKRRLSRVDQGNVSFVWPLSTHVSALGKWNYDFEIDRTNEALLGLEYSNCCWQVRVMYHRHVEPHAAFTVAEADDDEGFLLQFVFRGLAGFGNGVERVLARGIKGYREEADF